VPSNNLQDARAGGNGFSVPQPALASRDANYPQYPPDISAATLSSDFLRRLQELLLCGESIVLLGPRYGGKSYVMKNLARDLPARSAESIELFLYARMRLFREEDLVGAIRRAHPGLFAGDRPTFDDFFTDLERLAQRHPKPLIFLISHLDSMVHELARSFLRRLEPFIAGRKVTVALSGEIDLWTLLSGADVEFTSGQRFLLQGFDLELFSEWIRKYADRFGIGFQNFQDASVLIWKQTGGSSALLGRFFWTIAEQAVLSGDGTNQISTERIKKIFDRIAARGRQAALALNRVDDVIASYPECSHTLEKLLAGGSVPRSPDIAVLALQFCGVTTEQDGFLSFASPVMEAFIRKHYDPRRFGDIYAKQQNFDEAFARYRQVESAYRRRPFDIDDRAEAAAVVATACVAIEAKPLTAAAGREAPHADIGELRHFMRQACLNILGFPEISFWRWREQDGWVSEDRFGEDALPGKAVQPLPPGLLPPRPDRLGNLDLIEDQHTIVTLLDCEREESRCAIVVGDDAGTAIGPERRRLLKQLVSHFVAANNRARLLHRRERALKVSERLNGIVNRIFHDLFHNLEHAGKVFETAAKDLLELDEGYTRVTFFFVDEINASIGAECMFPFQPEAGYLSSLNWRLNETDCLHPYVLDRNCRVIVPDRHHPRVDDKLRAVSHDAMRMIVVPIGHENGAVVGTMQVEFDQFTEPTEAKADLLEQFARHLASALEQSRRMSLLEAALRKIPQPVVIAGSNGEVIFSNDAASRKLGTTAGLARPGNTQGYKSLPLPLEVQECFQRALTRDYKGHEGWGGRHEPPPQVTLIDRLGNQDYRAAALTASLMDFSNTKAVGALLHIQEESYYKRILEIWREVEPCTTLQNALETLVKALRRLFDWAPNWARYYQIDSGRLLPKACYDPDDPERAARFWNVEFELLRNFSNGRSWQAIDEGKPLVFCYDDAREPDSEFYTPHGIRVLVDYDPQAKEILKKRIGEMWIDFPLSLNGLRIGKFTVPCTEELKPEDILMLTDFTTLSGELVNVINERERRQEAAELSAAERTIDAVAHDINTRLAQMSPLLGQYRNLEQSCARLTPINDTFQFSLQGTLDITGRAKDLISSALIIPKPFELVDLLNSTLAATGVEFKVVAAGPVSIVADATRLETVIREMVSNSRKANEPQPTSVTLEVTETRDENIRIRYTDNGPGIPREYQRRIFDLFFSRRPGQETSTGLGMSIISRTIRAHGGSITVGDPPTGAEFVIVLPRNAVPTEVSF